MRTQLFSLAASFVLVHSAHADIDVRGRLVNQARVPIAQASVSLKNSSVTTVTDSLGSFRLAGLAATAVSKPFDTLVVQKDGVVSSVLPLERKKGHLILVADVLPSDVVSIALAQVGKGPNEVGNDRQTYPLSLRNYMPEGAQWCSEFVSWAYKAAGFPLTEGKGGIEWMQPTNKNLKSWFQKHARFVERTDPYWETVTPQPGDMIRYENGKGGHSGLVAYAKGSTLVTIEGNVGNRVRRLTIRNWRKNTQIDGIGTRSGYLSAPVAVELGKRESPFR